MGLSEIWPLLLSAWLFLERLVCFFGAEEDDEEDGDVVDPFFLPRRVGFLDSTAPLLSPSMEALGRGGFGLGDLKRLREE